MLGSESCLGTLPATLSPTAAGTAAPAGWQSFFLPTSRPNPGGRQLGTGLAGCGGVAAGATAPVLSLRPELESTGVPPEGGAPKQDQRGQHQSVLGPPELHQVTSLGSEECLSFWSQDRKTDRNHSVAKGFVPKAPAAVRRTTVAGNHPVIHCSGPEYATGR